MKKIFSLILAACMASACAVVTSANPDNVLGSKITASYGTPVIDGKVDDVWASAELQNQEAHRSGTGDSYAAIRFLYDADYLYLLAEVHDMAVWGKDLTLASQTYQTDAAEICLSITNTSSTSIDPTTDAWFGITAYGDYYSSQLNWLQGSGAGIVDEKLDAEFVKAYTSLQDTPDVDGENVVYYIEAAWALKAYDSSIEMKEGTAFGFEISYNANDEYNGRTRCIGWSDATDGASGNPSLWGEVVLGAEGGASSGIAAEYKDYQSTEIVASNGACDDAAAAAASFGKTLLDATYTFVDGSNGFANEGPENLWDDDVTTKFCSNEFPTLSLVELSAPCTIDGVIMATANDNASYNGRSPFEWGIFVSADGAAWTQLAYGDDTFFEEADFTYYGAAAPKAVDNVKYVLFQSEGGLSGTFQVSEVALTGTAGAAAPAAEPAPVVEAAPAPAEEAPAPVEEAPAPAEETPAEPETVEAPAEAAPAPTEAPETFDAGIIAAVAAVVSLAGYAASKKH